MPFSSAFLTAAAMLFPTSAAAAFRPVAWRRTTTRLFSVAASAEQPKVKPLEVNYSMEEIVSLCKRRGIIFPSSEIYNGYAGFYDYGPLGSELKKNVKDAWWKYFVTQREDVVGLDSSIIHNPETWKSSGKQQTYVSVVFLLVRSCFSFLIHWYV
jgi:hypothetical protein